MALEKGIIENDTGIDPGPGTYLTEIVIEKSRVGIEAMDNDSAFQETAKLREEHKISIRGFGAPTLEPGLNGNDETSDGPFVNSVDSGNDNEELDDFSIEGTEYAT